MMLTLVLLAEVALLRAGELLHARRLGRRLREGGARLVRRDGMGAIVLVHILWFAGCAAEATFTGEAFGWWSGLGLLAAVTGATLRYASMAELGWRWNTRVYVLPEAPLVASGPYAVLRHPIYVGVGLELAGLPLALGLWRTAAAITLLNALALRRRIRLEDAALGRRSQAT